MREAKGTSTCSQRPTRSGVRFSACVYVCVSVRVCAEGETARRHACDGNPCVSASTRCTSHPGIWKDKPPQHIKVDGYPLPSGPFVRLLHKAIWTGSHPLHYYMHLCIERPLHPLLLLMVSQRDAGGGPFQHPLNITYQMLKGQSRPLVCPLHCKKFTHPPCSSRNRSS